MKYGRLVFIEKVSNGKNPRAIYQCDCGNKKEINIGNVKSGRTVSCGCRLKETHLPTHGMTGTPTYHTWENMIARCKKGTSQNKRNEKFYGKISVCKDWETFDGFFKDMGIKPDKMTIDRIDGKGNYCKENCRWATRKEQQNNIKSNVKVFLDGKEIGISEFIKKCGISVGKFYSIKKSSGINVAIKYAIDKRLGVAAIIEGLRIS